MRTSRPSPPSSRSLPPEPTSRSSPLPPARSSAPSLVWVALAIECGLHIGVEAVFAQAADEDVGAGAAGEQVVAGVAVDDVVTAEAFDAVVAGGAVEGVGSVEHGAVGVDDDVAEGVVAHGTGGGGEVAFEGEAVGGGGVDEADAEVTVGKAGAGGLVVEDEAGGAVESQYAGRMEFDLLAVIAMKVYAPPAVSWTKAPASNSPLYWIRLRPLSLMWSTPSPELMMYRSSPAPPSRMSSSLPP
jgi:hypothetical protein